MPYAMKVERFFYERTFNVSPIQWVCTGPFGDDFTTIKKDRTVFDTRKECENLIAEFDDPIYHLSHGEYARPSFHIVGVKKKWKITTKF